MLVPVARSLRASTANVQRRMVAVNPGHRLWSVENKGTAFTQAERDALRLRGLLPPAVETLEQQAARVLLQFNSINEPLNKYNYLNRIKNTYETLFYHLLIHNLEAMCPVVYTPTVGKACQKYGQIFRTAEGMYFCKQDRGYMRQMLDNWPYDVSMIVVTDGSRILGLGDLGANGMGIPIGKLSLYVACGGFHPQATLPVMMDTGTNNQDYLNDPLYLGLKHQRLGNTEYYAMWEEFLMAVKDKWPNALVQFEDISNDHCFELLKRYRNRIKCFNDDIQGTGAVIAAGYLGACKLVKDIPLQEHTILFLGAGSASLGVADQICHLVSTSTDVPVEQIRSRIYLMDSRGLVTSTRGDALEGHKVAYARSDLEKEIKTLPEAIDVLKPTVLIGLSSIGGAFTEEVIRKMGDATQRPIIFALSNPTSSAECTPEDAYKFTDGRAIFASGSPFSPVTLSDGRTFIPGQGNNMYIFPGLGLGASLARSKVSDGMATTAAAALAEQVTLEDLEIGRIYPPLTNIRAISAHIAAAVMEKSFEEGLAQIDRPDGNLHDYVVRHMYDPHYPLYSH